MYPLKELSRELEELHEGHGDEDEELIRYMSGHRYTEFRYLRGEMPEYLDVFADSDWAKCWRRGRARTAALSKSRTGTSRITVIQSGGAEPGEAEFFAIITGVIRRSSSARSSRSSATS